MQRARRLASTAVVAVLAVSGLSACRAEPDVAAYVGRTTITEARIEGILDDAERKLASAVGQVRAGQGENPDPNAQAAPEQVQLQIKRKDVLEALLSADVLGAIAKQRNIVPAEIDPAQVAQSLNLPADAEYVGIYARYRGYLSAFGATAKPVSANAAELREVYDRFKRAGGFGDNAIGFEEFSGSLNPEDRQTLEQSIGLREQLKGDVAKLNVTVNPRYGVQELPLLPISVKQKGTATLIGVPLAAGGSGDSAVVEAPSS